MTTPVRMSSIPNPQAVLVQKRIVSSLRTAPELHLLLSQEGTNLYGSHHPAVVTPLTDLLAASPSHLPILTDEPRISPPGEPHRRSQRAMPRLSDPLLQQHRQSTSRTAQSSIDTPPLNHPLQQAGSMPRYTITPPSVALLTPSHPLSTASGVAPRRYIGIDDDGGHHHRHNSSRSSSCHTTTHQHHSAGVVAGFVSTTTSQPEPHFNGTSATMSLAGVEDDTPLHDEDQAGHPQPPPQHQHIGSRFTDSRYESAVSDAPLVCHLSRTLDSFDAPHALQMDASSSSGSVSTGKASRDKSLGLALEESGLSQSVQPQNLRTPLAMTAATHGRGAERASGTSILMEDSTRSVCGEGSLMSPRVSLPKPTAATFIRGDLIGKGSFGFVYRGMQRDTNRTIAMKEVRIVDDDAATSEGEIGFNIASVQRELAVLKQLNHPNIVKYLNDEVVDGMLRIYMEYVAGGSVSSALKMYGTFGDQQAAQLTLQLLKGLAYLHYKGIVHRDLKGDNLLLETSSQLKIADFGTAKSIVSSTMTAKVSGTAYFMAPEVLLADKPSGTAADIWSVGCCVIEMLTGMPPLSTIPNQYAVMMAIAGSPTVPLDQYIPANHQWSKEAVDFITQCLQVDPEVRPTARELLHHPWIAAHLDPADIFVTTLSAMAMTPHAPLSDRVPNSAPPRSSILSLESSPIVTALTPPAAYQENKKKRGHKEKSKKSRASSRTRAPSTQLGSSRGDGEIDSSLNGSTTSSRQRRCGGISGEHRHRHHTSSSRRRAKERNEYEDPLDRLPPADSGTSSNATTMAELPLISNQVSSFLPSIQISTATPNHETANENRCSRSTGRSPRRGESVVKIHSGSCDAPETAELPSSQTGALKMVDDLHYTSSCTSGASPKNGFGISRTSSSSGRCLSRKSDSCSRTPVI